MHVRLKKRKRTGRFFTGWFNRKWILKDSIEKKKKKSSFFYE